MLLVKSGNIDLTYHVLSYVLKHSIYLILFILQ